MSESVKGEIVEQRLGSAWTRDEVTDLIEAIPSDFSMGRFIVDAA